MAYLLCEQFGTCSGGGCHSYSSGCYGDDNRYRNHGS